MHRNDAPSVAHHPSAKSKARPASTLKTASRTKSKPSETTTLDEATLGARLRDVRVRSGLSLRSVARKLGVSPSFVSQLENDRSRPSVATLYSLAQLLNVSMDELFEPTLKSTATETPAAATSTPSKSPKAPATKERTQDTAPNREKAFVKAERPVFALAATPRDNQQNPIIHVERRIGVTEVISRSELASPGDAWDTKQSLRHLSITSPGHRSRLVMDTGVVWEQLITSVSAGLVFLEIEYPPGSCSTNGERMLRHSGYECGYLVEGELEITAGFESVIMRPGDALGFDSSIPHLFRNRGTVAARGIWCVFDQHP
jgi:transcriptional regulator with XRE-family HTH domain